MSDVDVLAPLGTLLCFEEITESIECKVLVRTEVDGDIQAHLCKEKNLPSRLQSGHAREVKSYVMEVSPIIFQDGGGGGGAAVVWDGTTMSR